MKKIFFVILLAYVINIPSSIFAAIKLPESISIGISTDYDAGKLVDLQINQGSKPVGKQTLIEYGIARTIKKGQFVLFETLTTNTKDIANIENLPALQMSIPNTFNENATSTYVAYIKYSEKNNPDNESFHVSKEFFIKSNKTPFIQVKNINFLHSNGKRFGTIEGPTIYSIEDALKYKIENLATSTSLEITFESNQDLVLQPKIIFSKIRSGEFSKEFIPKPITIKKGTTYIVIPLPVFEYDAGVYMGDLLFDTPLLQNKVDLQYIVGGEMVSVGTVSVVKGEDSDSFKFDVFGTPIDIDRIVNQGTATKDSATASTSLIYKVQTQMLDSNDILVQESNQSVDFNQQKNFSVAILKKIFNQVQVSSVKVIVTSPTTGKVVFEGVKKIEYLGNPQIDIKTIIYIILWILFTVMTMLAIFKRKVKTVIVFVLILIALFISRKVSALYSLESYRTDFKETYFSVEGFSEAPSLLVQENISNTTYTCGNSIPITFKIQYLRCANSWAYISAGFSWISGADAIEKRENISHQNTSNVFYAQSGVHTFYISLSPFVTTNMPAPTSQNSPVNLYSVVVNANSGPVVTGYSKYTIPVNTTCQPTPIVCNCSNRKQVCTQNGVVVSETVNAPACFPQASCGVSVSGDQATFTTTVTQGLGAISYKDTSTGLTITNPITKTIPLNGSVAQNTTITDAFDELTANSSCTAYSNGQVDDANSTPSPSSAPRVYDFMASPSIVEKGDQCKFSWRTEGMSLCSFKVNNTEQSLSDDGKSGTDVSLNTLDGNNKNGLLTCTSSSTPTVIVTASTTCRVNPEVRQQ